MTNVNGLLVETLVNGPIAGNCYLAADPDTKAALVIDPGDEAERILAAIRDQDLRVEAIVCTHAHIDHAGAVAPLQRLLGAPFLIHDAERPYLQHLPTQAAMFGLGAVEVPEVDRALAAGDTLQVGSLAAQVLFTPGHSAGGCCLYFAAPKAVFVGDTLFSGSIGRSDLPGGSAQVLLRSIREQLLSLDDAVVVFSGHGPATDIGTERRTNPFLQPGAPIF